MDLEVQKMGFRLARIRIWAGLGVLAAVAVAPRSAPAAIIDVEIATTLSQIVSLVHVAPANGLPMAVGDDVVLRFQYDDSVGDSNPLDGSGQFQNAIVEATVEFPDSGLSYQFGPGGFSVLATIDDAGSAPILIDSFGFNSLGSVGGDLLGGDPLDSMVFGFAQASFGGIPTLVVNDRINPPFSFDGLGSSQIILSGVTGTGESFSDIFGLNAGTATIVGVPEPGLATLLAVTLLGTGFARRRR